jgi:hypothetical protein
VGFAAARGVGAAGIAAGTLASSTVEAGVCGV